MKTKIIKTMSVLAVFSTLVGCNHNSPAPAQPAPVNPPTTSPTSTTTPEGTATALIGHWYLDSMVSYITNTNHTSVLYGFNTVLTSTNGGGAIHKEIDLKSAITLPQSSTSSSVREGFNIFWNRNLSNDTVSYGSNNINWTVTSVNSTLYLNGGDPYFSGYIRSFSNNNIELAPNTASTKTGQWSYWHRQ